MEKDGYNPELRNTLFSALTGRSGDVSGRTDGSVREMLTATYGLTKAGRVNTRAAATDLGVTQRTVQRWLAGEDRQHSKPSTGHMKSIATKSRQTATTQKGRKAALTTARGGSGTRYGAKLSITGFQGPTRAGNDYRRNRRVTWTLSPEDYQDMLDAYQRGGDKGWVTWAENYADSEYVAGWQFDSIDSAEIGDPRGY